MIIRHLVSNSCQTRIALLAACGLALAGCDRQKDEPKQENAAAVTAIPKPKPAVPMPSPPFDRAALLGAVTKAASAFAARADDRQAQAELAGRQFTFRVRFGCSGPSAKFGDGAMSWSYDPETQALKIRAAPDISLESPMVKTIAGPEVETVQGFWVMRPWLLVPSCVEAAERPGFEVQQPEAGIAQFFTGEDSRVQRRSRPFEAVQKVEEGKIPDEQGFDLVLTGRLKELPDGRVIKCAATGPSRRPACIASAEFDRVSVENAETRSVIAEWGVG